ncbi:hypothetical protein VHEMI05855 [[Torrubiella] hemipterigena]|uniref:N-acetyltransferase domain-containing protein n=1 Tax=[Torrubiella] hemipterigena TaxID=1531966 RepID=A0A0A1SYZ9_9HYPO|nr:hypothetical protein VHEMI05855 [[Torrubiella] hemipterigena]
MSAYPVLSLFTESQLQELYTAHSQAATTKIRLAGKARLVRIPGTKAAVAWASDRQMHNGVPGGALAPSDDPTSAVGAVMGGALTGSKESAPSPCHWIVWPAPQPTLEQALLSHGFVVDDDEPAMVANLDEDEEKLIQMHRLAVAGAGTDFEVTPVEDGDTQALSDWITTWGCGNTPIEVLNDYTVTYKAMLRDLPRSEFSMFVGRVDGQAVGTGIMLYAEGVAAVHYIVTLPEFRRRGIGKALTLHSMMLARRQGYRIAMLTASKDGQGVYEALGFRKFGQQTTYLWG